MWLKFGLQGPFFACLVVFPQQIANLPLGVSEKFSSLQCKKYNQQSAHKLRSVDMSVI